MMLLSSLSSSSSRRHNNNNEHQLHQNKHQALSLFSFLASSWSLRNIKGSLLQVPPKLIILATIITGTTTTLYKVNTVIRSESVRRATYFWWNIGPVVVHYKFTKFWFTKINTNADITKRNQVYNELHTKYAPKCYDSALHLKGLYIKLMQICSSRPDFIPIQYIKLFILAQDSLPQYPIEQIKDIINNSLLTSNEQGLSYDDIFINIDEIALGTLLTPLVLSFYFIVSQRFFHRKVGIRIRFDSIRFST